MFRCAALCKAYKYEMLKYFQLLASQLQKEFRAAVLEQCNIGFNENKARK
jgi:hypothetical protein